jgi:hypothetical protein
VEGGGDSRRREGAAEARSAAAARRRRDRGWLQDGDSEVSAGSEERTRRADRADLALERDGHHDGRTAAAGGERAGAAVCAGALTVRPGVGAAGAEQRERRRAAPQPRAGDGGEGEMARPQAATAREPP